MIGAPIKPGALCVIVNSSINAGAFVTAVRVAPEYRALVSEPVWEVTAPTRPLLNASGDVITGDAYFAVRSKLFPISDPDADVTETNEEELTL